MAGDVLANSGEAGPEKDGAWASATELRHALREGDVSAREAAAFSLERIEAANPLLGAFLTVTAERAHDAAAAADSQHALLSRSGRLDELGPLHGMPTAFKDLTDVAGVPTTHGSAALNPRPAPADSPIVGLLRGAGIVSLGKTQVPEFGLTAYSENRIGPPSRNPHGPGLSSGGSSGGSAAAVAAGLVPFAAGSDGGGSIRIPAAACGIVGLKVGRGTIPEGQSSSDALRLVVAGPLARSAEDAALLLDAMVAGIGRHHWRAEHTTDGLARGDRLHRGRHAGTYADAVVREPRQLRIAVGLASPWDARYEVRPEPEALEALRRGTEVLAAAGHLVVEHDVRFDNRYPDAFTAAWTAGVGTVRIRPEREPLLTPLTRAFRRRAQQRSRAKLEEALAFLHQFERDMAAQLADWDVLLSPALAQMPRPVGWFTGGPEWRGTADDDYRRQCEFAPWSSWVNVCGLPAVVATTHWTADRLPMGVQAVGHPGSEGVLLQLARLLHVPTPGG